MSFFKTLIKNTISLYIALISFGVTALVIAIIFFAGLLGNAVNNIDGAQPLPSHTYNVKIELNLLQDKSSNEIFWSFGDEEEPLTFFELQETLHHIKQNKKVNKVIIKVNQLPGGLSNYSSISAAIDSLTNHKRVLIYAQDYNLKTLLLASGKSQNIMHPLGNVEIKGLSAQILYFHEMLNNIGIEAEPLRAGKFKSAIEPYILDSISEANKFQLKELLEDIWGSSVGKLSTAYQVSSKDIQSIANNQAYLSANEAMIKGFIDTLMTWDEVLNVNRTIDFVSVSEYFKSFREEIYPENKSSKIALLCLEGPIMSGSDDDIISEQKTTKYLREIYQDTTIKALVVRINSPGGSALASETIYRAMKRIERKIPVVISMGDVAASGGYYIAAASDFIFAEPTTITGSIGVYGLMMNTNELSKKIGISVQKVKTNELSDFPSFDRSLKDQEKAILTKSIQSTYDLFLERVSEGRNLSINEVHELAQGRVWSANDALSNNLIDAMGGYNEAIFKAKELASLKEYSISVFPKKKTILEKLKAEIDDTSVKIALPKIFEKLNIRLEQIEMISEMKGPQMRLPFFLEFQ